MTVRRCSSVSRRMPVADDLQSSPFRLPVQWVNRPSADFRGLTGLDRRGEISVGARVRVLPAGISTTVARILVGDEEVDTAVAGQSVTIVLAEDVDVSRGDVLRSCRRATGGGRPVRGDDRLDARAADAAGSLLSHEDRHANGHRPRSLPSNTKSTSTRSSMSRRRNSSSTISASAGSSSIGRSSLRRIARIGISVASF